MTPADVHTPDEVTQAITDAGVDPATAAEVTRKLVAYHGTPHDFDKFDLSKLGTGEGHQAYGHGLYFAEKKDIADHYRKRISELHAANTPLTQDDVETLLQAPEFPSDYITSWKQDEWRHSPPTWGTVMRAFDEALGPDADGTLKNVTDHWRFDTPHPGGGHLYQVDLAPQEHELLDWDKPLSEQSEHVKAALRGAGHEVDPLRELTAKQAVPRLRRYFASDLARRDIQSDIGIRESRKLAHDALTAYDAGNPGPFERWWGSAESTWFRTHAGMGSASRSGEHLYEELAFRRSRQPGWTGTNARDAEDASKHLRSIGVRGIKFLDQGSRVPGRGKYIAQWDVNQNHAEVVDKASGDVVQSFPTFHEADAWIEQNQPPASRNYVIFDDADVTITHKNDVPVGGPDHAAIEGRQPEGVPGQRGEPDQGGAAGSPSPEGGAEPVPAAREYGTVDAPERQALGEFFDEHLTKGGKLATIADARRMAGELLGGPVKPGTMAAKHVDEAVEIGVTLAARRIVEAGRSVNLGDTTLATFNRLVDLYDRQPNLGVRTSTSVEQQAYSTPAPLAFAASHLAGIHPGSTVYEPTAGNGMLLIGANPNLVRANELNPDRAAALKAQGFAAVTEHDATTFLPSHQVDAVVMNPPFGAVRDDAGKRRTWTIDGVQTNEVDQAIALHALHAMQPDGRAVLILGAKGKDAKTDVDRRKAYLGKHRAFFKYLYDNYNVVEHVTASGDLYAKQGAGWPVDVIAVDGRGKATRKYPWQEPPRLLNTWQEVGDVIRAHPNVPTPPAPAPADDAAGGPVAVRPGSTGVAPAAGAGGGTAGGAVAGDRPAPDLRPVPAPPGGPSGLDGGPGGRPAGGGVPAGSGGARPGGAVPAGPEPARPPGPAAGGEPVPAGPADANDGAVEPAVPGERPADVAGPGGDRVDEPAGLAQPPAAGREPDVTQPKPPRPAGDAETAHQVTYTPHSAVPGVGTLVPKNMVGPTQAALEAIADRNGGSIDQFVAGQLGYSSGELGRYFSAEQVDALAMAIDNYHRGAGFIIGDQTGVGKGRIVAGMIRFATRQGLVPVFVTKAPNLYADIVRDLIDIGMSPADAPFEFLVTNNLTGKDVVALPDGRELRTGANHKDHVIAAMDAAAAGGALAAGGKSYHALATTYSQLQFTTPKGQDAPVYTWRNTAMERLAARAYFILDEAHEVGGTETGSRREAQEDDQDAEGRAGFVRRLITNAPVFYSSATYAKRPQVMSLYFRTDMIKAVDGDAKALSGAIARGGVPLQQVVASMLAEAGQYARRERTFKGVEMAPKTVDVGLDKADKISAVFRAIRDFDRAKADGVAAVTDTVVGDAGAIGTDNSTGEAGASSVNFSSIMWNLVDQAMLTLKVDAAAEEVVQAVKRGEQVVIAVDNTMEAMLSRHVDEHDVRPGDAIDLDFRKALRRYLDRSREMIVKDEAGNVTRHWITDEELGPDGVAAYNAAADAIENSGLDLPASPIDWLHMRLRAAGIETGEITGRQTRIEYGPDGLTKTYAMRPDDEAGIAGRGAAVQAFNAGKVRALIINQAGSTGLSLHASEKFPNRERRHMVILQAAKNIDTFMQMLGRVHRTGQVVPPRYTLLTSNAPAETRPAAVLAKKLASLNASVTASKDGSVSFDVPDFLNQVGDDVIAGYVEDNPELNDLLGDHNGEVLAADTGGRLSRLNAAAKVTGRVALLPVTQQKQFYDEVGERFEQRIKELDALGENPLVAHDLDLDAKTVSILPLFAGQPGDPSPFAAPAVLEELDVKLLGKPMKPDEVTQALRDFYGLPAGQAFAAAEAEAWTEKHSAMLRQETLAYADKVTQGMPRDQVQKRQDDIQRQWAAVVRALRSLPPGTPVRVTTPAGDVMDGVVTSIERKGKTRNPAAPGAWQVKMAVADARRTLTLPVSRIGDAGERSLTLVQPLDQLLGDVLPRFEDAQSVSRERRYVATGNLLAAYEQLPPGAQIVNFTTNDGRTRQGALLPRSFSPTAMLAAKPVEFPAADKAVAYLRGGFKLETPDRGLTVQLMRDALVVETAKSKARGGRYFQSKPFQAAIKPGEFVSAGNKMRAFVDANDQKALKRAVGKAIELWGLSAHEDKDEARQVLGLPSIKDQIDRDRRNGGANNGPQAQVDRLNAAAEAADLAEAEDGPLSALFAKRKRTPAAPRISPDPLPNPGEAKQLGDIIREAGAAIGARVRRAKGERGSAGVYYAGSRRTSIRHAGDVDTAAHELGHHLDDLYDAMGQFARLGVASPFDGELIPAFSRHGSRPGNKLSPALKLVYRRAEGVAEWFRAWLVNPAAAERAAPTFARYFEQVVPPDVRDALRAAGDDVRRWVGQQHVEKILSNVRVDYPGRRLVDRLRALVWGDGPMKWNVLDAAATNLFDDLYPIVKAVRAAGAMRDDLPDVAPGYGRAQYVIDRVRAFAGQSKKFERILTDGPVRFESLDPAAPFQPAPGVGGGAGWLLGEELLRNQPPEVVRRVHRDAIAVLTGERVLEKADQLYQQAVAALQAAVPPGSTLLLEIANNPAFRRRFNRMMDKVRARAGRLAGFGGGMLADDALAAAALRELRQDPARYVLARELAQRYRAWADSNLQYLLDGGRMTPEQVQGIRDGNQFYSDFHRVMTDEGFGGSNKLGSVRQPIHTFKGSTRQLENPFVNLLEQTARVVHETDRNAVLVELNKLLKTFRGMYDGPTKDTDAIGSEAKAGDEKAIKIWENGKLKHWQYEPTVHRAMVSLGRIPELNGLQRFISAVGKKLPQWSITHNPGFIFRQLWKDALNRGVISEVGSKPWDVLRPLPDGTARNFELAGGAQHGGYMADAAEYHRYVARQVKRIQRDPHTVLAVPVRVARATLHGVGAGFEEFGDVRGRKVEFAKAYRDAMERGMTATQAATFAGARARDLADWAVAGRWIRSLQPYIPFLNPSYQGLSRMWRGARNNPLKMLLGFALYVLLPRLLTYAWNARNDENLAEYRQLPAWRRDLCLNFKVGHMWVSIPTPYEFGVFGAGVERALESVAGNPHALEGYGGSALRSLSPVDDSTLVGPLKPIVEILANHDFFFDRNIIPDQDVGKAMALRDTSRASRLGKILSKATGVMGWETDPRQVDHLVYGMTGGLGWLAQDISDAGRPDRTGARFLQSGIGLVAPPPAGSSMDVQYVQKKAHELGDDNSPQVTSLRAALARQQAAGDLAAKDAGAREVRQRAAYLRDFYDRHGEDLAALRQAQFGFHPDQQAVRQSLRPDRGARIEQMGDRYGQEKGLEAVARQANRIRHAMEEVYDEPSLSPAQRAAELEGLHRELRTALRQAVNVGAAPAAAAP